MKEFEETIKIHPNSAEAHFNLGVLYGTLNQGDKAIFHILKAGNLFGEKMTREIKWNPEDSKKIL
ncbi:MAG: hypothetical protein Ct9H300mP23_00980 [Nitrospinota bacterium]|nr:MAG: hypothetical protein Ct9H300mP23_00980 [Nitrospinota bacterium]